MFKLNKYLPSCAYVKLVMLLLLIRVSQIVSSSSLSQGKLLEIEFDFKGEPVCGHITHCELLH